jgi:hypothetical protein
MIRAGEVVQLAIEKLSFDDDDHVVPFLRICSNKLNSVHLVTVAVRACATLTMHGALSVPCRKWNETEAPAMITGKDRQAMHAVEIASTARSTTEWEKGRRREKLAAHITSLKSGKSVPQVSIYPSHITYPFPLFLFHKISSPENVLCGPFRVTNIV